MKIHLSADYQSEIWFYPVCDVDGRLTAVELVTQFVHDSAPITLPQDLLLPQIDESQQLRLLQSQVGLLEQYRALFERHSVLAFIRLDDGMARTLLTSELLMRKIKQLPFIMLNITETFPQLRRGRNNPLLASLAAEFNLSLSHFGAGKSPANAVYDNLFNCICLDKDFIHALAKRASFAPFIQSIIDNFRPHCDRIIICGIDDEALLDKAGQLTGVDFQGALFPVVKSDALHSLLCADNRVPSSQQPG
ncbi:EAL domain-containing protein [Pantoea sp. C2G6]|uniref:EAL domain-containing protein n=1 Tax=Pantoea sp. C2G6 TaxID=3243084 RepID=UPI003EDA2DF0